MFHPVVATEIEFYLHGAGERFVPSDIIDIINNACSGTGLKVYSVQQERGRDQYEIALLPYADKNAIVIETSRCKALMVDVFAPHGIKTDFTAKPIPDQPGSGLHIHVHLEENGKNIFFRDGYNFCPVLLHAIGGMLELMNPHMPVFAPYEESYLRFTAKSNAPTTVSWGTNNRTTAIRLPNKPADNKHVEHRVAGSDADVARVIDAVLAGIEYGIANKCDPGAPVYGDASLPQYAMPLLVKSLSEARKCMSECIALA